MDIHSIEGMSTVPDVKYDTVKAKKKIKLNTFSSSVIYVHCTMYMLPFNTKYLLADTMVFNPTSTKQWTVLLPFIRSLSKTV